MKIGRFPVKVFKMRNRRGFAAICYDCVTEGLTRQVAVERMEKAIRRVTRKK